MIIYAATGDISDAEGMAMLTGAFVSLPSWLCFLPC